MSGWEAGYPGNSCFPSSSCLSFHPPAHSHYLFEFLFAITSATCQSQCRQIRMPAARNCGAAQGKAAWGNLTTRGGPSQTLSQQLFDGAGEWHCSSRRKIWATWCGSRGWAVPEKSPAWWAWSKKNTSKDGTLATLPFQPYRSWILCLAIWPSPSMSLYLKEHADSNKYLQAIDGLWPGSWENESSQGQRCACFWRFGGRRIILCGRRLVTPPPIFLRSSIIHRPTIRTTCNTIRSHNWAPCPYKSPFKFEHCSIPGNFQRVLIHVSNSLDVAGYCRWTGMEMDKYSSGVRLLG